MPRVRLTHYSSVSGAEGGPGEIVDASPAQARDWLANGGAVELEKKTNDKPATEADGDEPEPDRDGSEVDADGDETETADGGSGGEKVRPAKKKAARS